MGTLREDRDGWIAQVRRRRSGQTISRTKRFPRNRKRDAQLWIQDTEAEIRKGALDNVEAARAITLNDVLIAFAENVSSRRGRTDSRAGEKELYQLKVLQCSSMGALTLDQIGPREVMAWLQERRDYISPRTKRRLKESSIRRTFDVLSSVFEYAIAAYNLVGMENPCQRVPKTYKPKGGTRSNKRLQPGEMECFLDELRRFQDGKYLPVILFMICTGYRRGEVVLLRKEWIDASRGVISFPNTKTGAQQRVITPDALQIVESVTPAECGRLFPFHPDTITDVVREICRRAGILRAAQLYEGGRFEAVIRLHLLAPRLSSQDLAALSPQGIHPSKNQIAVRGLRGRLKYKRLSCAAAAHVRSLRFVGEEPVFGATADEIERAITHCEAQRQFSAFSSHGFRAEFVTRLLMNKFDKSVIKRFTGHQSDAALAIYDRMAATEVSSLFAQDVDRTLGNRAVLSTLGFVGQKPLNPGS